MGGYNPVDQLFGSGTLQSGLEGADLSYGTATGGGGFSNEQLRQMSESGGVAGVFGQQKLGQRYTAGGGLTGQQGYDALSQYAESDDPLFNIGQYMQSEFGIGEEYQKYMTPFQQERFGFMERGLGLEQEGLQQQLGGAESAFQLGGARLGMSRGRGAREASGQRDVSAARAGMAGVGGITQGYEQQKQDLFRDYSAGMQGLQADLGQAQQTYGLGMQKAQLGYETDVYGEKERQTERFYDDLQGIMQMKQGEGGGGKK